MNPMFPFFVGSPRSGTTLIRVIFDSHSQLAVPRESHFIVGLGLRRERFEANGTLNVNKFCDALAAHRYFKRWKFPLEDLRADLKKSPPKTLPDGFRRLYQMYADLKGKPRYADKSPRYVRFMPILVDMFPEAKFVHIMRDGRDVVLSNREAFGKKLDRATYEWVNNVVKGRTFGATLGPERYFEYRHEDFVADPVGTVKSICEFLELPYEEDLLRYYEVRRRPSDRFFERFPHARHIVEPPRRTRDWRDQMTKAELRLFERMAGDVLEWCGYERATTVKVIPRSTILPLVKVREGMRGEGFLPAKYRRKIKAVKKRLKMRTKPIPPADYEETAEAQPD